MDGAGRCRAGRFRAEGIVRQRFLHRGQPSDVVMYAPLATDPRPAADVPTE